MQVFSLLIFLQYQYFSHNSFYSLSFLSSTPLFLVFIIYLFLVFVTYLALTPLFSS